MSVDEVIGELRKIEDPLKINSKWNQMSFSDPLKYPTWTPISRDGVFYETNANERLLSGDVPFEGTLIFGLNSYEGTLGELSYGWMESSFTPEMVKNVFATCKGFSVFQNFNMNSLWSFISRSLKVNCHLWLKNR